MKIETEEARFADMGCTDKKGKKIRPIPVNGIELFENDGSEDGGKRWAILSNDLPEETVQEIVGILTKLPQRLDPAGMANTPSNQDLAETNKTGE